MNRYELAVVVSNYNENVSVYETIDAIKSAGFTNVFLEWYNEDWNPTQEEQLKYARENGLNIIFVHLGYKNINDLWINEETDIVDRYMNDIKICYKNKIPMVVMHLTRYGKAPAYNELGLKRIKQICDYAESLNIKIAFENTKIENYLDYVMDNIKNDNVGICFDSGHYHAHFNDKFDFYKFKNRIFAVHFHDNDKSGDQHLLPFDGTINWDEVICNLKQCNYDGPITLETHYNGKYLDTKLLEFYKEVYETGLKLKDKFED